MADKVVLLTMTDHDGVAGYYVVPEQWYEWTVARTRDGSQESPPDDLVQAWAEEGNFLESFDSEQISNLHHLAIDSHYVSSIAEAMKVIDGREVIEQEGMYY